MQWLVYLDGILQMAAERKGLSTEELYKILDEVDWNEAEDERFDEEEDEEIVVQVFERGFENSTELGEFGFQNVENELELLNTLPPNEEDNLAENELDGLVHDLPNLKMLKLKKKKYDATNLAWTGNLPDPPNDDLTPLKYFKMLLNDDMFEKICEETNKYALQKDGVEIKVKIEEIEKFIGILLYMGVMRMPQYRLYWSPSCRFNRVADAMPRNQYEKIRQYLHINDNTKQKSSADKNFDKLFKVRPLLTCLKDNVKKIAPEEEQVIDEQMIPFKGRSLLKQYLKNKPHKWGFKVFTRAGASGIMHDFEIYVGKDTCRDYGLGFSSNIVLHLVSTLPDVHNFKMYFDNWFSSLQLAIALKNRGIFCVGTIRLNRIRNCSMKAERELKILGRGSYDFRVNNDYNICLVRWYDNKAVQFISSFAGVEPVSTCRRFSQKEKKYVDVQRPDVVKEYNESMGAVDLMDMLIELYRINVRSKKWYMRIVFWTINVAVVNAWLLYRCHQKQRGVQAEFTLLQFQIYIADGLVSTGKQNNNKRGRPSSKNSPTTNRIMRVAEPIPDTRYDNLGHFPSYSNKKNRCRNCRTGFTTMFCIKWNIWLCLTPKRNCFLNYHTK